MVPLTLHGSQKLWRYTHVSLSREQRPGEKVGYTGNQTCFSMSMDFLPCLPTSPRKLLEQVSARTVIHVGAPEIICLTLSQEQRGAFSRTREKGLDASLHLCFSGEKDTTVIVLWDSHRWYFQENNERHKLASSSKPGLAPSCNFSQAWRSVTTQYMRKLKKNKIK